MERDAAFTRRVAESTTSESAEDSSDDDEQTYVVREGTVSSADADETVAHDDGAVAASGATRLEGELSTASIDPRLERPPDLRESVEVADVAPDGSSIGGGLTSPTGESLGAGRRIQDSFEGALGGRGGRGVESHLSPLSDSSGPDADLGGFGPDPRKGGTDRHFALVNEMRGADGKPDLSREEYDETYGGAGTVPLGEIDWGMVSRIQDETMTEMYMNSIRDDGVAATFADEDGKSAAEAMVEEDHATFWGLGSGDDDEVDEEEQPDPTAGDDVITGESIATAIRVNDPGVYAQPTQDGDSAGTAAAVARASAANDPQQLTNYGPEGPQTVGVGDNWTPPVDTLFDPPPEGASADMLGAQSALADPGAALGGGSLIGSSTPDEAPPPPDPPPGEDPDQGPLGPPEGGGEG